MVLAFVLIIVTLAIPHLGFIQRHVMRAEVDNVRVFITYVHRLALATATDQIIYCDPLNQTLTCGERTHALSRGVRFGTMPGVQGPPSAPTHVLTHPITFKDNRIVCYAQGTLDAGTLYFTDDKATWQYAVSLGVSPLSYIRTSVFDGTWKRCT